MFKADSGKSHRLFRTALEDQYPPVSGIGYSLNGPPTTMSSSITHSPRASTAASSFTNMACASFPNVGGANMLGALGGASLGGITHLGGMSLVGIAHGAITAPPSTSTSTSSASASSASTSFPMRLSIDASGSFLAISLSNKEIQIFDFLSAEYICTLLGHSEVVLVLFFSNDGRHLVSCSANRCHLRRFKFLTFFSSSCSL